MSKRCGVFKINRRQTIAYWGFCCFLFIGSTAYSQPPDSLIAASQSYLKQIIAGDSLLYYQCHVEEASVSLSTASGQTISGNSQKYSITEKFVVVKELSQYRVRYYTSSYSNLPNRRFSGLKIREADYWNFKFQKEKVLTENDVKVLLALERKGHEAMEYDFIISRSNRNQIIIRHKKEFKQLVIEGAYVISKLFGF